MGGGQGGGGVLKPRKYRKTKASLSSLSTEITTNRHFILIILYLTLLEDGSVFSFFGAFLILPFYFFFFFFLIPYIKNEPQFLNIYGNFVAHLRYTV